MKTLSKAVAVASLLSAGIMSAQVANAEVSYNAAAVSDYVWRGASQNSNGFAVQGGADYAHESGVSAGVWGSTLDLDAETGEDSLEVDLYAAYGFAAGGADLSVGVISYVYDEADTAYEANFGASKDAFSGLVSVLLDAETDGGQTYFEGAYDVALPQDLGLSLHAGFLSPEEGDGYADISASIGKSLTMVDVAATVIWNDQDSADDETLAFLSVSKEF